MATRLIFLLLAIFSILTDSVFAEVSQASTEVGELVDPGVIKARESRLRENCSGSIYRSKKKGMPVYEEFNLSSQVVYRLRLGEKVCYIGEREGFAILDWREFEESSVAEKSSPAKELAYARLVDLWPPRTKQVAKSSDPPGLIGAVFGKAREYFRRLRYGQPPSDALEPIRPALDAIEEQVDK